jgi:magnesium-transporting ATPase (P-type)
MKKTIAKIFFSAAALFASAASAAVTIPPNTGLPSGTIAGVVQNLMKWLLGIFGFIAIIGFVISGVMYLTSAGNDKQQEKAKNQMMWSIIGVVVGLAGYIIVKSVDSWLRGGSNF